MIYDHVDIGTCDFDVADNEFYSDKKYLLVEPMSEYLDKLPSGENIQKENSACSNNNGSIDIYYVPEDEIISKNLPLWMKGCSKIGEPHKIIIDYFNTNGIIFDVIKRKRIKVISFYDLVKKYEIEHISNLKIDTEGHDHIIFKEAAKLILKNKITCDSIKLEYIIGRYGNTDQIDDVVFSLRNVYPNINFESENLTISK
jgi:hypothetical protein